MSSHIFTTSFAHNFCFMCNHFLFVDSTCIRILNNVYLVVVKFLGYVGIFFCITILKDIFTMNTILDGQLFYLNILKTTSVFLFSWLLRTHFSSKISLLQRWSVLFFCYKDFPFVSETFQIYCNRPRHELRTLFWI